MSSFSKNIFKFNLKKQFYFIFISFLILMSGLSFINYNNIMNIESKNHWAFSELEKINEMNQIKINAISLYDSIILLSEVEINLSNEEFNDLHHRTMIQFDSTMAHYIDHGGEEKEIVLKLEQLLESLPKQFESAQNTALNHSNSFSDLRMESEKLKSEFIVGLDKIIDAAKEESMVAHDLSDTVTKNTTYVLVFSLIIIIFLIVVTLFLIQKFVINRIKILEHKTEIISSGDFTESISLKGNDELTTLANRFDLMRCELQKIIKKVSVKTNEVYVTSEELTVNSEENKQVAEKIAISIEDIASSINDQSENAQSIENMIKNTKREIENIAEVVDFSTKETMERAIEADKGNQAIHNVIKQIQVASDVVIQSTNIVENLEEKTKKIEQIVDMISDITNQTNLLALNASIEAARAGDHGKGFAVVAGEVKKLANESQNFAQQISALVNEIKATTLDAVMTMKKGEEEVLVGRDKANTAGEYFEKIYKGTKNSQSEMKTVLETIQELNANIENTIKAIANSTVLSQRSAHDSQTVASAIEQQLVSINEITNSITFLNNLANDLQNSIEKFKI